MKVVFIIGNGFDINLGLATQYENFYRSLIPQHFDLTLFISS